MKDQSIPSFSIPSDGAKINITIPPTDASLVDQGYTYNQAGLTYNQVGVEYGGIQASNQDVTEMLFTTDPVTPHNIIFDDIYTPFVPPPKNSGMLMGILGLTYP